MKSSISKWASVLLASGVLFSADASTLTQKEGFHMTPFLMKHTQNYMLENKDMQAVANLGKGKQALQQEVSKIGGGTEDEAEQNEMNQAASLGIIGKKFATHIEAPKFDTEQQLAQGGASSGEEPPKESTNVQEEQEEVEMEKEASKNGFDEQSAPPSQTKSPLHSGKPEDSKNTQVEVEENQEEQSGQTSEDYSSEEASSEASSEGAEEAKSSATTSSDEQQAAAEPPPDDHSMLEEDSPSKKDSSSDEETELEEDIEGKPVKKASQAQKKSQAVYPDQKKEKSSKAPDKDEHASKKKEEVKKVQIKKTKLAKEKTLQKEEKPQEKTLEKKKGTASKQDSSPARNSSSTKASALAEKKVKKTKEPAKNSSKAQVPGAIANQTSKAVNKTLMKDPSGASSPSKNASSLSSKEKKERNVTSASAAKQEQSLASNSSSSKKEPSQVSQAQTRSQNSSTLSKSKDSHPPARKGSQARGLNASLALQNSSSGSSLVSTKHMQLNQSSSLVSNTSNASLTTKTSLLHKTPNQSLAAKTNSTPPTQVSTVQGPTAFSQAPNEPHTEKQSSLKLASAKQTSPNPKPSSVLQKQDKLQPAHNESKKITLNMQMSQMEALNLQHYRLNEMKNVAHSLQDLRAQREETKKKLESQGQGLVQLNHRICKLQKLMNKVQEQTGLYIPNFGEQEKTKKKGAFFDTALSTQRDNNKLNEQQTKLKRIQSEVDTKIEGQQKSDFLSSAEHIMKVDQFIQDDLRHEEQAQQHHSSVKQYADSVIGA